MRITADIFCGLPRPMRARNKLAGHRGCSNASNWTSVQSGHNLRGPRCTSSGGRVLLRGQTDGQRDDGHGHVTVLIRLLRIICQQSYLLTIIWYSIGHLLFHSRLKTFLFCKSFPLQPFFFFFGTDFTDSPTDCLLLFLSISVFYF